MTALKGCGTDPRGGRAQQAAPGREPANQPMIGNWIEPLGDCNPIGVDYAAAAGHPEIVAAPAMIQRWTIKKLVALVGMTISSGALPSAEPRDDYRRPGSGPHIGLLRAEGFGF
jgi:hypothetical protein